MENCKFPNQSADCVGLEENKGGSLVVDSCKIHGFQIATGGEKRLFPRFQNSTFVNFYAVLGESYTRIKNCDFDLSHLLFQGIHDKSKVIIDSCRFTNKEITTPKIDYTPFQLEVGEIIFQNNIFSDREQAICRISAGAKNTTFFQNKFDLNIKLSFPMEGDADEPCISLVKNSFVKKLLIDMGGIARSSNITPEALNFLHFGILTNQGYYDATNPDQLKKSNIFRQLQKTNKLIFDHFKETGDLESANKMYVRIMETEGRKIEFEFQQNPSFQTYFRHWLNKLLRFYTNYGTDPARAILISVYVILLFAVFYFFFPSDWDITSKSRLIQNFREFIGKNDKGYIRPFFTLAAGLFISLINATTLSVNAFTTLGFGNIPTHGFARYVCVLQGFIGWFLLSIFTVALFNQAQF